MQTTQTTYRIQNERLQVWCMDGWDNGPEMTYSSYDAASEACREVPGYVVYQE